MDVVKWLELDMRIVRDIIILFIGLALSCLAVIIVASTYYSDPYTLIQKTSPFIVLLFTSTLVTITEYKEYKKLKRKIEKIKEN